jgi:hypothetical protein
MSCFSQDPQAPSGRHRVAESRVVEDERLQLRATPQVLLSDLPFTASSSLDYAVSEIRECDSGGVPAYSAQVRIRLVVRAGSVRDPRIWRMTGLHDSLV